MDRRASYQLVERELGAAEIDDGHDRGRARRTSAGERAAHPAQAELLDGAPRRAHEALAQVPGRLEVELPPPPGADPLVRRK